MCMYFHVCSQCACIFSFTIIQTLTPDGLYFIYSESAENIASLLTRMCLQTEVVEEGKKLRVEIPPTRADIL